MVNNLVVTGPKCTRLCCHLADVFVVFDALLWLTMACSILELSEKNHEIAKFKSKVLGSKVLGWVSVKNFNRFHNALNTAHQRWKWVIFRDPWPMWPITQLTHDPHDPWPMAITSFHHFTHGTRRGRAWWYWTTLSVLTAKKLSLQLW